MTPAPDSPPGTPCTGARCTHADHAIPCATVPGLADDECHGCSVREGAALAEVARLKKEAEPAALHEASFAVHCALCWGFDPCCVSPVSLARAATELSREFFALKAERGALARENEGLRETLGDLLRLSDEFAVTPMVAGLTQALDFDRRSQLAWGRARAALSGKAKP